MTKQLFVQAMAKFFLGVLLVGLLIFLPAGTLRFAGGCLLMGVLFVPMFLAGLFLMVRDPDRLRRRLDAREKEMTPCSMPGTSSPSSGTTPPSARSSAPGSASASSNHTIQK